MPRFSPAVMDMSGVRGRRKFLLTGVAGALILIVFSAGLAAASPPTIVTIATTQLFGSTTVGPTHASVVVHATGSPAALVGEGILTFPSPAVGFFGLASCSFAVTGSVLDGGVRLVGVFDSLDCANFWGPRPTIFISASTSGFTHVDTALDTFTGTGSVHIVSG